MRVILVKGGSAYPVLRLCIDELAQAFRNHGYEPAIVDLADEDLGRGLERAAAKGRPALVFSFAIGGDFRAPDRRTVGQLVGAPHVIQYVDHPLSDRAALDKTAPDAALLFADESHVDTVRALYGPSHFAFLGFSPPAALGELTAVEPTAADFCEERPIPSLLAGPFARPEEPWNGMDPGLRAVFGAAVEIALAAEWIPALEALDQAIEGQGVDPPEPRFREFRKLAAFVHEHVGQRRRLSLLKAAGAAGLPVHVYGDFDPDLDRYLSLSFHGEIEIGERLALMRASRIVLNANGAFGAGSDERTLSAMLAGAAAVTDTSRFYAGRFRDGQDLMTYRWTGLSSGVAALKALVEMPETVRALAASGQRRVIEEHRWEHRIATVLAVAELVRARGSRAC